MSSVDLPINSDGYLCSDVQLPKRSSSAIPNLLMTMSSEEDDYKKRASPGIYIFQEKFATLAFLLSLCHNFQIYNNKLVKAHDGSFGPSVRIRSDDVG